MKKIVGFVMMVCMVLTLIPLDNVLAATEGSYTYTVSNGKATITDVVMSISGDITIPSTLGGYPVSGVGDYAFEGCENLISVSMDNITSIGDYAFSCCESLTSISMDNVTFIGDYGAFEYCRSLTEINVSSNNTSYCSIDGNLYTKDKQTLVQYAIGKTDTHFNIPDGVTSVGIGAFYSCENLISVSMDSVTFIGLAAFASCSSLTSVRMDNVTSIGDNAFRDCEKLTSVSMGNVISIGDGAFEDCSSLTSVRMDNVTSIGDNAFRGCEKLTSVSMGNVISIGDYAFEDCWSLTSVSMDNVTSIGDYAFGFCRSLTDVYYNGSEADWNKITMGYGNEYLLKANIHYLGNTYSVVFKSNYGNQDTLFSQTKKFDVNLTISSTIPTRTGYTFESWNTNSDGTGTTYFPGTVYSANENLTLYAQWQEIKNDGITYTDESYFEVSNGIITGYSEKGPNDVIIPPIIGGESVISIGDFAFADCESLTSVYIPNGVISIGDSAFEYCNYLTNISIPDSITTIGAWAFSACSRLASVSIPDSVISIGNGAFSGSGLKEINVDENNNTYCSINGDLYSKDKKVLVQYAKGKAELYLELLDEVTSIGDFAFEGCHSLIRISIPNSVISIGNGVFVNCDNLKEINVDENNNTYCSVNGDLYSKDKKVLVQYAPGKRDMNVTILENVVSIGDFAFADCESLTNINNMDGVTEIGDYAFEDCRSLTSVSMDGVNTIGKGAFSGCKNLTSVSMDSVKTIGDDAFSSCRNLTSVSMKNVTEIGDSAFCACESLTNIIVNSLISIGQEAFLFCYSLTSISLPGSVASIGDDAFCECYSLTDVYYSGSEEEWNNILIGSYNDCLKNATIHYNYTDTSEILPFVCAYADDKLSANITLNNISKSCSMAFAVYDGKKLVCVKEYPVTAGQTSVPVEITADENYKDYTVKAFCVDSLTGMKSLSNAVSAEIQ